MATSKDYYSRNGLGQHIPRARESLPTPNTDLCFEEVLNFPFLTDEKTRDYLNNHGRVMFIIRGPSGTRKHKMASMFLSKYPSSEVYCADDYFAEPFAPGIKSRENLKTSHHYCEEKALKACQESKSPIVIKNTSIRKWEMQYYINLAIEYCYTTIMVVMTRKLRVTSKVLEKTNTQGLKEPYFNRRLRQWEEVVPVYTGWTLSPVDTSYLMREYEKCLESLSELQDFTELYCTLDNASAKDYFTPEYFPFCIATYCQNGTNSSAKSYYLSPHVQAVYGKVFPLVIQAFIVTKALTAAVVHLSKDMETLVLENSECMSSDVSGNLSDKLSALSVVVDVKPQKPLKDYKTDYLQTFTFCSRATDEKVKTKKCSFIVLSTAANKDLSKFPYIKNIVKYSEALFSSSEDCDGNISASSFHTLNNNSEYCRLSHDSWLILPSKNITVQSVFTGIYT